MNKYNEVSVIIPAYNAGQFIREAVVSVLDQTVAPREIIVVNDGSKDNTEAVLSTLSDERVKVFYQENQGVAAALNYGIKQANGSILAFLDADDTWEPSKLKKQLEVFTNEGVEMAFTLIENFIDRNITPDVEARLDVDLSPFIGIHKSTLMIRRASFMRVGLFDLSSQVDFLEWYSRAKDQQVKQFIIEEVLVKRRIHKNNMSLGNDKLKAEFPKVIKQILDRRRCQS